MKIILISMLSVFFLINILSLNVIMAQENCTDEYCILPNGQPINLEGEKINCENFYWVENYIKSELNKENTSENNIQLVNILKNANYNLQNDLNKLKDQKQRYFYGMTGFLLILILSWVYFWTRIIKFK